MKNSLKKWNNLSILHRVKLLQWALPVAIIIFVLLYQTFFVNFMHRLLGDDGHYAVEVTFYGVMGPLVTFFVLAWIHRWLSEKEKIERQVKEQGKRLALIRTEEGKRVAKHLHRDVLPNLAYVHTKMDYIQGQLLGPKPDPKWGAQEILSVMTTLRETIGELRDKVNTLRKGSLFKSLKEGGTLAEELQKRADEFKQLLQLDVGVHIMGDEKMLPFVLKSVLWRIIGEGLNNIALHAQAKKAEVQLDFDRDNQVIVTLTDNGVGFDTKAKLANPTGMGLVNMANEVEQNGGTFQIESIPGKGTKIIAQLPLRQMVTA